MYRLTRSTVRTFKNVAFSNTRRGTARGFATPARQTAARGRVVANGVGALLAGAAVAYGSHRLLRERELPNVLPVVFAAGPTPQPSVVSETRAHAVYIWIHLTPTANVKQCAKVAATLQEKVNKVTPPSEADEDDEILAGVGFGPNFYRQVTNGKGTAEEFSYPHYKGYNGAMPSTGGDVFIHAKSNNISKLYELTQLVISSFPTGAIDKAEDVYGWVYQNGRDLSGFIDGTENPADEEHRSQVAISHKCGGSYVITQRWIHDFDTIQSQKERTLESWVGRSRPDSIEDKRKSVSSHVARMVGTTTPGQTKPFEIVRQSQPYGTVCGESGLFFIGYAASPANHLYMLNRMVGADKDGLCDDIMKLSRCISGNFWYFPCQEELRKFC